MASKNDRPSLSASPERTFEGETILLRGSGWCDCPITLFLDGKPTQAARPLVGTPTGEAFRADGRGEFVLRLPTMFLDQGKHALAAVSSHKAEDRRAEAVFELEPRPTQRPDGRRAFGYYWRDKAFLKSRFGHLGYVPEDARYLQQRDYARLRLKALGDRWRAPRSERHTGDVLYSRPVTPGSNFTPVGAGPVADDAQRVDSGRARCIAIDPADHETLLVGTANGGIWKTRDGGASWRATSDYNGSLAVDCIAYDPVVPDRVWAGTGEYHPSGDFAGQYSGNGLLRSDNRGDTWVDVTDVPFLGASVTRIVFDPAFQRRMVVGTSIGLYAGTDVPAGVWTWERISAGSVTDLIAVPHPMDPFSTRLIVGFYQSQLVVVERVGGTWSFGAEAPIDVSYWHEIGRIRFGQCASQPNVVYASVAKHGSSGMADMLKTVDGGQSWEHLDVRRDLQARVNFLGGDHSHDHFFIPASDLTASPVARSYTSSGGAHTHTVQFSVQDIRRLAAGQRVLVQTPPDPAVGHTHTILAQQEGIWNTGYNLHIAVHPTEPGTFCFGDVLLYLQTLGGVVFRAESPGHERIHVDQHGAVYDPPDTLYVCNDGGVFRSDDRGITWRHRNRGLATLQYFHSSSHPVHSAVMLAGAIDNGTHRYGSHTAWRKFSGGDGCFTAIDPAQPDIGYSYGAMERDLQRRSFYGGTVHHVMPPATAYEFGPPFAAHITEPGVLFFGGNELWSTANRGDDGWAPVGPAGSRVFAGNARTIAIHLGNPNMVYVGTTRGRVYQFTKGSTGWPAASMVEVTRTGLPAEELEISSIAVTRTGALWLSFSSYRTDFDRRATNEYVYHLPAGSGNSWQLRSTGLAISNPINSIVVDPANDDRGFCGGDAGVWAWDATAQRWDPWDPGLPNTPVYHLHIHERSRLLRAATFGRGVWERHLDRLTSPEVELRFRDNILDDAQGEVPSGVRHPFDADRYVYWWNSADIKIDSDEGGYQTPSPSEDPVFVEHFMEHRRAYRGRISRVYVQVHNRGPYKASNVRVRAFRTAVATTLPSLPSNFWTTVWTGTNFGPDWTAFGGTVPLGEIEPGQTRVASWTWDVAADAAEHTCVLAVTDCTEDNQFSGELIPDLLVPNERRVTVRNLTVADYEAGLVDLPDRLYFRAGDTPSDPGPYELVVDWGNLPKDATLVLGFEKRPRRASPVQGAPKGTRLSAGQLIKAGIKFSEAVEVDCGDKRELDTSAFYRLRRGKEQTTSLRLALSGPVIVAVVPVIPKDAKGVLEFTVLQRSPKRVLGGNTFRLRPYKVATARS